MEKKHYESVIILTPVLSEKMLNDAIESYKQLITGNSGELIHSENWGLTKLAYPIQKKTTGFYQIFEFTGDNELVDKLEIAYRRDEQVLRYLTVSLDKHAVIYNERRRKGEFKKTEKPKSLDTPAELISPEVKKAAKKVEEEEEEEV
jgi:small subunit ribosomal protein S6